MSSLRGKIGGLFTQVGDKWQSKARHLSSTSGFDALLQERALRFEALFKEMEGKKKDYTVGDMTPGTGPKFLKMEAIQSAIKAINTYLKDDDRKVNSSEALDTLEGKLLSIQKKGKLDGRALSNLQRTIAVVDERKVVFEKLTGLIAGVAARVKGLEDAKETKRLSIAEVKDRTSKIEIVDNLNKTLGGLDLRSEAGVLAAKAAVVAAAKDLKFDLAEKGFLASAFDYGHKTQNMMIELHTALTNETYCQPASKEALKADKEEVVEVIKKEEEVVKSGGKLETIAEEKEEKHMEGPQQ